MARRRWPRRVSLLVCKWRKKWAAAGKLVNLCEKLWIPRSRDFACVCVISFRAKFINVEVSTRRIGRKNIYIDFGQRGTFLWIMKNINSLSLLLFFLPKFFAIL